MIPAPTNLERTKPRLPDLKTREPFDLFAHFSDPHAPDNAPGYLAKRAELYIDGELHEELVTSEMTQREFDQELRSERHVFEWKSDKKFKVRSFEIEYRGKLEDVTFDLVSPGRGVRRRLRRPRHADGVHRTPPLPAWRGSQDARHGR